MKPDNLDLIRFEMTASANILMSFVTVEKNMEQIAYASELMATSLKDGHKLLSCGNGGSYSDAQHFASELSGKYRKERPALAAMALGDGGTLTCIANDFGYGQVFKRQLEAIGHAGDVLLALSTSGESENIIVAAEYAKRCGIHVVSITGKGGGRLKEFSDVWIEVPHSGDAGKVQESTIVAIHAIVNSIEKQLGY